MKLKAWIFRLEVTQDETMVESTVYETVESRDLRDARYNAWKAWTNRGYYIELTDIVLVRSVAIAEIPVYDVVEYDFLPASLAKQAS